MGQEHLFLRSQSRCQRKHQLLEDATLSLTGVYIHAPRESLRYRLVVEERGNCRKFTGSSSLRDCTCCDNHRELSLQTKATSHSALPFQHAHLYHFSYCRQADPDLHVQAAIRVLQAYLSVLQLKQMQATIFLTLIHNHLG